MFEQDKKHPFEIHISIYYYNKLNKLQHEFRWIPVLAFNERDALLRVKNMLYIAKKNKRIEQWATDEENLPIRKASHAYGVNNLEEWEKRGRI